MEPIRHTLTARLRYLRMYREDLDQLLAFFQRDCAKVTISDSTNRYKSLDEMKEHVGVKVRDLEIQGEQPGVHFMLNQSGVVRVGATMSFSAFNELRTEEITDAADVLFYKIKDFLLGHEQPSFRKAWIVPAIASPVGLVWFALHNAHLNREGQTVVGSLPGLLMSLVVFTASLVLVLRTGNMLSLETRRNSASFFVRNREEFAKHAVTAAISGIVGLFFGWLIGRFLK